MLQRREVKTPYITLLISPSSADSSDHVDAEVKQESNYSLNPSRVPGWTHYYDTYYKTVSMDSGSLSLSEQLVAEEKIEQFPSVTGFNFFLKHFIDKEEIEQFYTLSPPLNLSEKTLEIDTKEPHKPILNELFAIVKETEQETMASFWTFELKDSVFEEIYIAHMEKETTGWRGWIPDIPEVDCTAYTEQDLLADLREALEVVVPKRNKARDTALSFLQKRAGRCLMAREPNLKDSDPSTWVVPIFTNVDPPVGVGEIHVDANTGEVLNTEMDVAEMIEKGHVSFGFESFAAEKQERLTELLALNNEQVLAPEVKQEMEALLAEKQALQIQNLQTLEKRLLS